MEMFQFANKLMKVHESTNCGGEFCCIHRPSKHHMRYWPMELHLDGSEYSNPLCYRVCPHALKHPDPDSVAYFEEHLPTFFSLTHYSGIATPPWVNVLHECDGCCAPREEPSVAQVIEELHEILEVTRV